MSMFSVSWKQNEEYYSTKLNLSAQWWMQRVIIPCTMWSLALFRSVCSRRCQDRGCLCSYSARPSRSTSSWSWSRDPCRSLPPWATSTPSYSTWSSCKTHQTNTVNTPHRNRQRFIGSGKGFQTLALSWRSMLTFTLRLRIPVLYCWNESRLKGSAVFPYHSQQLFLCLSWAQDISDQQKRPAGHFSALLEWRSQRTPLTATIEYIGKQLPEQKKQHNAERRERRIVLAQRTMNRD